jgi:hypothetical protein
MQSTYWTLLKTNRDSWSMMQFQSWCCKIHFLHTSSCVTVSFLKNLFKVWQFQIVTLQHPICSMSNLQCCQISEEFVWVGMVPNCDLARSNLFSVSALLPDLIRICLSCYSSKWWPCKIQFIQCFCIIARFWRIYLSCPLTKEKVCNLPLLNHSVLEARPYCQQL